VAVATVVPPPSVALSILLKSKTLMRLLSCLSIKTLKYKIWFFISSARVDPE